jgi:hypothetical protein
MYTEAPGSQKERASPPLVVTSLHEVNQRPFQHKFVDQYLALHELVVKLSWTILQRI